MNFKPYTSLKVGVNMYVVIQQRKETKIPKGSVYREIKRRDDSPMFYNVGEPIPREPKFKYDIRLKDKGIQHHICTVTYWDVVDGWAGGSLNDSIESYLRLSLMQTHGFTKEQFYSDDVKALWREYNETDACRSLYLEIDRLAYLKFQPIIDMVKKEYAVSEEGKIKAEQDRIKEQAISQWEKEEEIKKRERIKYEKRSKEQAYKQYESFFGGNSRTTASAIVDSDHEMVQELVQAGYKALSRKYHPDIGGSHESFVLLGKVKDKLMGI